MLMVSLHLRRGFFSSYLAVPLTFVIWDYVSLQTGGSGSVGLRGRIQEEESLEERMSNRRCFAVTVVSKQMASPSFTLWFGS